MEMGFKKGTNDTINFYTYHMNSKVVNCHNFSFSLLFLFRLRKKNYDNLQLYYSYGMCKSGLHHIAKTLPLTICQRLRLLVCEYVVELALLCPHGQIIGACNEKHIIVSQA